MGKICYYQNTIKHMEAQTVHIVFGMCCIMPVDINRVKPAQRDRTDWCGALSTTTQSQKWARWFVNHGMYLCLILSISFRHWKTPNILHLWQFFWLKGNQNGVNWGFFSAQNVNFIYYTFSYVVRTQTFNFSFCFSFFTLIYNTLLSTYTLNKNSL